MRGIQILQPTVFIMLGYPGAGKTFFARQFSALSNSAHIYEDHLRYELFEDPQFSLAENNVIFRLIDVMLENYLSNGLSVVVDGSNHMRGRKKSVKNLAKKHNARVLYIWVQTDLETSLRRAASRDRRSVDDKYTKSITKAEFDEIRKQIAKPKTDDYVVISGKHVFNNQYSVVCRKISILDEPIARRNDRVVRTTLGGPVDVNRRTIPRS